MGAPCGLGSKDCVGPGPRSQVRRARGDTAIGTQNVRPAPVRDGRTGPRRTRQDAVTRTTTGSRRVAARARSGREQSRGQPRSWWDDAADGVPGRARRVPRRRGDRVRLGPGGPARGGRPGCSATLPGRRVLEVGSGAAQCVALAAAPRARSRSRSTCPPGCSRQARAARRAPRVCPYRSCRRRRRAAVPDASFDLAFSAYGAVPFVADSAAVMREVARVLRPGGRWVFSVTHPMRWAFPDDPGDRPGSRRGPVVLRPARRTSSDDDAGRRDVRRAPPHPRRPGARADRGRASCSTTWSSRSGRPTTTRVWGGWSPLRGRVTAGHRDLGLLAHLRRTLRVDQGVGALSGPLGQLGSGTYSLINGMGFPPARAVRSPAGRSPSPCPTRSRPRPRPAACRRVPSCPAPR